MIKKIQNTWPWTSVISDLNGQDIVGNFYKKELQKTKQKEFRVEKVIKRKGDKLYVKCKLRTTIVLLKVVLIKKTV